MGLFRKPDQDFTYKPPYRVLTGTPRGPVDDVLKPGEKLLWSGQPAGKLLVLRQSDYALVPFALFWTGFALLWEFGAIAAVLEPGTPDVFTVCFPLFGVPFVLIGFYMLGGRFVGDYYTRRRTWYALTDRRVLALMKLRSPGVVALPLHRIDCVDIDVLRNGRGTLTFHGSNSSGTWKTPPFINSTMTVNGFPRFEQIENPKQVYDMVLEAQEDVWARQRSHRT